MPAFVLPLMLASALAWAWAPAPAQAAETRTAPGAPAPAAIATPAPAAAAAPAAPEPAASPCPPPLASPSPADPARDRGLLWRLQRDGRSSWLFGTVHVGKPAWQRLGPKLETALRASDLLALEIDPGDPDAAAAMVRALSEAALKRARQPQPVLAPELLQRLARATARACLAADALAAMPPVMQATLLTVIESRWVGLDGAYAQEQLLAAEARRRGLRVVALETVAQQVAALAQDDTPASPEMVEQTLRQIEDGTARRVLARLAGAWEAGDLATLQTIEQWCECLPSAEERAFAQRLNDDRNPNLAAGIDARHRSGARVFAAVGVLHMTGPSSLLRLLAARGFKVQRVPLP
jgi:uncharacterized protein YbaP (TraB family)